MSQATGLKKLWADGGTGIGLWCVLGDTPTHELAGRAGYDYVTIDLQHGLNTWGTLPLTLRVLRAIDVTVLVRVPSADPDYVMRALDLGADGVVVPMIDDVAMARRIVESSHYLPTPWPGHEPIHGGRSYGPVWADHDIDTPRTPGERDRDVICVAQIETAAGLANAADIAAVPGIDALYVGPYDLALSTGRGQGTYRDDPEIDAMIGAVIDAANSRGKVAAMHCDGPDMAAYWAARGARMLTCALDSTVVRQAYAVLAADVRGALER